MHESLETSNVGYLIEGRRSGFSSAVAPQPTFTLIADFSRGLCRVNKRHSRSASLDIDNRKDLALVGATTAPTTTIPGDRAAISELPLAEAFRYMRAGCSPDCKERDRRPVSVIRPSKIRDLGRSCVIASEAAIRPPEKGRQNLPRTNLPDHRRITGSPKAILARPRTS